MKAAIITGASGFVGHAVASELATNGVQVYAVIRDVEVLADDLLDQPNVHEIHCDMADYDLLPSKIPLHSADAFYHFAWDGSAGPKRADYECQLENVRCSCKAVQAAHDLACKKFIFAGSIVEYEIETVMQTDQVPAPSTLYSSAKKAADYFCRTIANTCGISYICGLISNIYGPGERSPRLINTSIRKLLSGEETAFSAGEQMYDFIYIDDAARIFAAIGEKGHTNQTYYIGSLQPKPLKYYLLSMRDIVSPNRKIGLGIIPFHGVSLTYREFDLEAVSRDTGVVPQITFEEGIKNTCQWIIQEDQSYGSSDL